MTRVDRALALLFTVPCGLLEVSCNATGSPLEGIAAHINATRRAVDVLVPGDVLDVRFTEEVAWDHRTTIGADGQASFLMLPALPAAGLTVSELDVRLSEAYRPLIQDYEVSLFISQRAPRQVAVLGALESPGLLTIPTGGLTLIEALALAGGQDLETAHLGNVLVVRHLESGVEHWEIDARVEHWKSGEPLWLEPHDVIYVPEKRVVSVYRWVDQYIRRMIPFPYLIPRYGE